MSELMNAPTPDDITSFATAPLPHISDIPSSPPIDAPITIPLPPTPDDEIARKPTLDLGLARFATKPLARLEMVYRSVTFPLIRLSRSSVLTQRKTVRLSSESADLLQDELRRAQRRVHVLGITLILVGTALMLVTLYLWHHTAHG